MSTESSLPALQEYVPPVRRAYPNARIIALGEETANEIEQERELPWRACVLDGAPDLFDVLAINRYKGQWNESPLDRQINVVESVPKIQRDLEAMIADLRVRGLKQTVALTEWNYWLHASHWDGNEFHELADALHGLFVAGMLHLFARLGADMELANFYHLVNAMGIFHRRGATVTETCLAEVFRLYRPGFPGQFVPLEVRSPSLGKSEPAVDALCLHNEAGDWLFLVNRSPAEPARVALPGFPARAADGVMLCGESPLHPLRKAAIARTDETVELPPLAMARLHYPAFSP